MTDVMPEYLSPQEIREEELAILACFDDFCRKESLRYSLAYGTLLGAVRHKGFIPWDDDIDVMMPRPDYNQFMQAFPAYAREQNQEITFASIYNMSGDLRIPFEKIINKTIQVHSDYIDEHIPEYLWIDVFPIDGLSDSQEESLEIISKAKTYKQTFQLARSNGAASSSVIKNFVKKTAKPFARALNLTKKSLNQLDDLMAHSDFNTRYCSNLSWCTYGDRDLLLTEYFDEFTQLEYEGHSFNCVAQYDKLLSILYGDSYMELPPEEKRISHSIKAKRVVIEKEQPLDAVWN